MGIKIGQPAPDFTCDAVTGKGEFTQVTLSKLTGAGKWVLLYFYPLDFTFVCPTEIRGYDAAAEQLKKLNCEAASVHW